MKIFILSIKKNTIAFASFLVLWFILSFAINHIPSPGIIFKSTHLLNAEFLKNLVASLNRLAIGFSFSTFLGIAIGILAHHYKIKEYTEDVLSLFQVIPGAVLGIIFLLLFGVGNFAPIALILAMVTPAIAINTANGLAKTPKSLEEVIHVFGGNSIDVIKHAWLPYLIPVLKSNCIIGSGLSIKILVLGEFIASENGIGKLLNDAKIYFNTTKLFFYLFFIVFIAYIVHIFIQASFTILFKKYL